MRPVWGARFRADHGASRKLAGFQYLSSRSLLQRLHKILDTTLAKSGPVRLGPRSAAQWKGTRFQGQWRSF
jgi:hypothetical protein